MAEKKKNSSYFQVKAIGGITFDKVSGHIGYRGKVELDPSAENVQRLLDKGLIKPADKEPAPTRATRQRAEAADAEGGS